MQNHSGKAALLVMDMQNGMVSRFARNEEVLQPNQKAIASARAHNIPVIFIRLGFSKGYPELNRQSPIYARVAEYGGMTIFDEATQIHPSVKPLENEPVVTKYRVSAFSGSNLEVILSAQEIDTLILSGITTSGVVLSTLREAADKDYSLTVLKDACHDGDPEVHHMLMEKLFPVQANVMTVDAWIDTLD
ncbi:cysteine hydrolase [Lederbergia sp. NSJ-179]|uniref:cysteine hydrolase family protein n=1 Tax=Lederbergia sp. NSJ-179 TaxID=2931402 RepID=UPI001FD2E4B7|nr:isochorismatase family cysteine hydrolase [Lederbergia sp. NSJ-179]MCJ7841875.1 cysteine hydrolase [Lederbergia sp. NSJ-179]